LQQRRNCRPFRLVIEWLQRWWGYRPGGRYRRRADRERPSAGWRCGEGGVVKGRCGSGVWGLGWVWFSSIPALHNPRLEPTALSRRPAEVVEPAAGVLSGGSSPGPRGGSAASRCALEMRPGKWGWSIGAAAGRASRRVEGRPSAGAAVKGQRGQARRSRRQVAWAEPRSAGGGCEGSCVCERRVGGRRGSHGGGWR